MTQHQKTKTLCTAIFALAMLAAGALQAKPEHGKVYKNWTVGCEKAKESDVEQCYIFQNLVLKQGGQRVLHVAVGHLAKDNRPAAIITFPLGISLPPGVFIKVDEEEPIRFSIERCQASGCIGALALNESLLGSMRKGNQARITFYDATRREIGVPVSLSGFTAGFGALSK